MTHKLAYFQVQIFLFYLIKRFNFPLRLMHRVLVKNIRGERCDWND